MNFTLITTRYWGGPSKGKSINVKYLQTWRDPQECQVHLYLQTGKDPQEGGPEESIIYKHGGILKWEVQKCQVSTNMEGSSNEKSIYFCKENMAL